MSAMLNAMRRWAAAPAALFVGALVVGTGAAASLAGCHSAPIQIGEQTDPLPPLTVELINNAFIPHVIDVNVGQTVTWRWQDSLTPNNVYFPDLGVTSPTYRRNNTWSYTFTQPGTFRYESSLDDRVTGVVVVGSAGGNSGTSASSSSP